MRSPSRASAPSSRVHHKPAFRFISRPLTLALVLSVLATAVVLSSVLAGARGGSSRSAAQAGAQAGQRQATKSSADQSKDRLATEVFANPAAVLMQTPNKGNGQTDPGGTQERSLQANEQAVQGRPEGQRPRPHPREGRLTRAHPFNGDLRKLPYRILPKIERPEREEPEPNPSVHQGKLSATRPDAATPSQQISPSAPAPAPTANFAGLDFATWGAGHPPDTVGDVGPTYYIQSINSSVGIFRKSDGLQVAAFTLNTFMSQGNFGNLCDTNNFGDPVILYDSFEDRWIITDFAFQLSGGNVVNPPGAFQCIAASKTGDPVSGGWNYYSINTIYGLGDYPKFGIWPDGLYMTASIFGYPSGAPFQNARAYAFNKQQMYDGVSNPQVVSFDILGGDFTILPSNARLQTGTPPAGTPNYYLSTWLFLNAVTVYKFHVDWNHISLSTFTGPDIPTAATSWPNATVPNAPSLGGNILDVLQIRAMMQNQYTNISGVESLWATHTVRRGNTSGFAAPRWYQVDVSGGAVNSNIAQAATWDPDGANVIYRFMPSLAVDRAGDLALGYSTSSSTTKPAIKYAGRLATDPVNTFSQTEQLLLQGTGTQTGTCGGVACTRWGDYSAMSLDPDGCTFWYTNMYYAADGLNHQTRIGSFGPFPGCTVVGAGGTLSGTVTATSGGAPIAGAIVQFGSRSTTTDNSGFYSFSIPAGTYPSISASNPGFMAVSASSIAVTDGNTTTQDFSLANAPTSACLVDTAEIDFQSGIPAGVDLVTTPDSAILSGGDPQNSLITTSGGGITATSWGGQTFTPVGTGQVTKIDVNLFCSGCSGSPQNLTVGIRATSGGFPTGADLATATIAGFLSGAQQYYTATFASPPTLTGSTMYAFVIHPNVNPTGTYALSRSGADVYSGGTRVSGTSSGTVWSNPLTATQTTDAGFRVWMGQFVTAGTLVSAVKDTNPAGGFTPIWSTFSWNATTPANTDLKFQIAGSNNVNGPFNFIGPDGTAATFYTTSPVQLSPQFYNLRYLEYKALLGTTDGTVTPTLDDATICFNDVDCSSTSATITPTPATVCTSSTGNTASGPAGMTSYAWGITNGTITSATNTQSITYTAGASGTVTLNLTVTAPNGCIVSNSVPVTIDALPPTPTISGDTNGTGTQDQACPEQPLTLHANGATGATSYQWYEGANPIGGATSQTYQATSAGTYSVIAINGSCATAASAGYVVQNPTPHSPFISFRGQDSSVTSLAFCQGSSQIVDSDSATGIQWYKDGVAIPGANSQSYTATQAGVYTAQLNALGCHSQFGRNVTLTVSPNPSAAITAAAQTCSGSTGNTASVANAGAGATYNWSITNGTITAGTGTTNVTYTAGAAGNLSLNVTVTNNSSCSDSKSKNVNVVATPATPTITPNGPTTFPQGGSVTLMSSSASGNQWYKDGNPIGSATNQNYIATTSGDYTVVVTAGGCSSAPSAPTKVTVLSVADLTVTKTHIGNFKQTDTGKTYTIKVTNNGVSATSGTVTVTDNLPAGLTATAWGGTGWTNCTAVPVTGPATLTCDRSEALDNGRSYPDLILTVDVSCTAPATVTNKATVSGGGDITPGNNSASDPTTINPETTAPSITCPGAITKFTDPGQNTATINPGTPIASDNCGTPTVTGVRSDGKALNAPYPVGVTIITWTAKDAAGNTASCAQSIVVMTPSGEQPHRLPPVGPDDELLLSMTNLIVSLLSAAW